MLQLVVMFVVIASNKKAPEPRKFGDQKGTEALESQPEGCPVDHAKTVRFSQDHSTKPAGCCQAMERLCRNQKTPPMRPCLS